MLKFLFSVTLVLSSIAHAQQSDLVLEGERWLAKNTGYLCGAFTSPIEATTAHKKINLKFEKLSTDRSLDNVLILASFEEDGKQCRYSALLFADNAAQTVKLIDSRAHASGETEVCINGKELLDQQFHFNQYLYWGHPHHVTIMVPDSDAAELCSSESTHIGIDFMVSGRINN